MERLRQAAMATNSKSINGKVTFGWIAILVVIYNKEEILHMIAK